MLTRGPDAAGIYVNKHIGLGHRRLSIIDLSPAGNNPMPNEDGTIQVVHNGEIYNFPELRAELAARHRFRSKSDTEVLVHGYEEWGIEGLLQRIRGMYAFAIWDGLCRELVLARDRVGKKPLFVYDDGQTVVFASDIKGILQVKRDLTVDPRAIDQFLFYYCIQQDRTIYNEVEKLEPATFAIFRLDPHQTTKRRYWSLSYRKKEIKTEGDWVEGLIEHLRSAVRSRQIADVPIGAFVSGGVDSGLVAALMSEGSNAAISTYTIGFDGIDQYDERGYARKVAERIGSKHHEIVLQPDVWEILPKLVWHYGEPFGDSSAVPTFYVAQAAKQFATVVLTGDGGDEAFAGYPRHLSADRSRRLGIVPGVVRQLALPATMSLLSRLLPHSVFWHRAALYADYLGGRLDSVVRRSGQWDATLRKRLLSAQMQAALDGYLACEPTLRALQRADGDTALEKMLQVGIECALPSDYLTKVDVASMANALEARCPFLDTDLLEFAATIPPSLLLAKGELKHLSKLAAVRYIPSEVIYRKKWGFGLPIGHWLRGEWYPTARDLLLTGAARERNLFDVKTVERVLEEHKNGTRDHKHRLWSLVVLEIWHRLFVDRTLQTSEGLQAA